MLTSILLLASTLLASMMLIARMLAHFDTWMLGRFHARFHTFLLWCCSLRRRCSLECSLASILGRLDSTWVFGHFDARLATFVASIPITSMTLIAWMITSMTLIAWMPVCFNIWSLGYLAICSLWCSPQFFCSLARLLLARIIGHSVATIRAWMFHSLITCFTAADWSLLGCLVIQLKLWMDQHKSGADSFDHSFLSTQNCCQANWNRNRLLTDDRYSKWWKKHLIWTSQCGLKLKKLLGTDVEPQHMTTAMLSNSKSVKDKKGQERNAGDPTTVAGCRIDWKVANLIVVSIHL
jgi:hypothetical protein